MSSEQSKKRVYCADYLRKHKKKIPRKRDFEYVSRIGVDALKTSLGAEQTECIRETDMLCRNCYAHFRKLVKCEQPSTSGSSNSSTKDAQFFTRDQAIDNLNLLITSQGIGVSPVRKKKKPSTPYMRRKFSEITGAVSSRTRRQIETAFDASLPGTSKSDCQLCGELFQNIRVAYRRSKSLQQRCQILTLFPASMLVREIQAVIPEATRYIILKSKKLVSEKHVWATPDPYERNAINEGDLAAAMSYYTVDELECSVQSPRSRDVVQVKEGDRKVNKAKRYMTCSIREAYRKFRNKHPQIKLSLSKFYSIRPKWVSVSPCREECVCTYCANFELTTTAAIWNSEKNLSAQSIVSLCMCEWNSEDCTSGDCERCPGPEALTEDSLGIPDGQEVDFAMWENGRLLRMTLPATDFIEVIKQWVGSFVSHDYVRKAQREAIQKEKCSVTPGRVVFHFDFSENWTVILPKAVQSYHWHKNQVSIFTCVVTASTGAHCYAIACDDTRHDSAAALCCLSKIEEHMDEHGPLYGSAVYVSDGASAHFKNRFQYFEMGRNTTVKKWLFSVPGHGRNACDGVGGVVKHAATIYNLRSSPTQVTQNAADFAAVVSENVKNVTLLHLPTDDLRSFRQEKEEEWKHVRPVFALRSYYVWEKGTVNPCKVKLRKV